MSSRYMFHQIEDVDNPAGASITIIERVDALELVMDESHFNKRIGVEKVAVVNEAL